MPRVVIVTVAILVPTSVVPSITSGVRNRLRTSLAPGLPIRASCRKWILSELTIASSEPEKNPLSSRKIRITSNCRISSIVLLPG
ncbi:MAG: hypothetical protein AW07_03994 [Candidatus Accumulibacter sp. SK-11]|nr:MAG: hypothetical protein AW07_03994 [Candidatus Accumulibacter sp. SK-11]